MPASLFQSADAVVFAADVEVRDRGPGFDPDELEPLPDPEDPERLRYEHGLGVQLIRELADDGTPVARLVVSVQQGTQRERQSPRTRRCMTTWSNATSPLMLRTSCG